MNTIFINLNDKESVKSASTEVLLQALAYLFDSLPTSSFFRCQHPTFEPVLNELLSRTCDNEYLRDCVWFYIGVLSTQKKIASMAKEMSEKYPIV